MLTNAKVGDTLLIRSPHNSFLATVDRTTKTSVFCGARKFNRHGYEVPREKWHGVWAKIASAEDIAAAQEKDRRDRCIHVILEWNNKLRELVTEKLERLAAILEDTDGN